MLPTLRHRLIIAVCLLLGSLIWLSVLPLLMPFDGSTGLVLGHSRFGWLVAGMIVLATALPVVILCLICSAGGNLVSGPFVMAAALTILAGKGGSANGFYHRFMPHDPEGYLPAACFHLLLETGFWILFWLLLMGLISRTRPALRRKLPPWMVHPSFEQESGFHLPRRMDGWLSAVICLVVAGALCYLLLQTTDTGQVIGSILLAFTIGGMLGRLAVARHSPMLMLVTPMILAGAGYLRVLQQGYADTDAVLAALYQGELFRLALALPIHYATAGVLGCTLGIGLAQALRASSHEAREAAGVKQATSDG